MDSLTTFIPGSVPVHDEVRAWNGVTAWQGCGLVPQLDQSVTGQRAYLLTLPFYKCFMGLPKAKLCSLTSSPTLTLNRFVFSCQCRIVPRRVETGE